MPDVAEQAAQDKGRQDNLNRVRLSATSVGSSATRNLNADPEGLRSNSEGPSVISCPQCHHRFDVTVTLHKRGSATFSSPEATDVTEVGPHDTTVSASEASSSTLPEEPMTTGHIPFSTILRHGPAIQRMYSPEGYCRFCTTREMIGVPRHLVANDLCLCDFFGPDDISEAFSSVSTDDIVPDSQVYKGGGNP